MPCARGVRSLFVLCAPRTFGGYLFTVIHRARGRQFSLHTTIHRARSRQFSFSAAAPHIRGSRHSPAAPFFLPLPRTDDGSVPVYFLYVREKYDIFSNPHESAAAETLIPLSIRRFASLHRIAFICSKTVCPENRLNSRAR